ncbi:uncharacterized protein LOC118184285 [Stegodyphus dumicola]|uniref:uncharacterized protein LOC118184285 n=1 Tax=Stegodyphus dumicola TaxID=202533 RepID=UPI0015B0D88D|nr:uncharacterized protein LOC118184285 [Stegodyphus dumicola]
MHRIDITVHPGTQIFHYVCPVTFAVINGDKTGLECLLRYGYQVNDYRSELFNKYICKSFIFDCNLGYNEMPRKDETLCCNFLRYTYDDVPAHHFTANKCNENSSDDENFETQSSRKYIINEVIIFLLMFATRNSPQQRSDMVDCFFLCWRARPTPYVRLHEITHTISEEVKSSFCRKKCWKKVLKHCQQYSCIFKNISEGPVMPRTLKHLSRCAVRVALAKSYAWHSGINKLDIPFHLKSYLRLEI